MKRLNLYTKFKSGIKPRYKICMTNGSIVTETIFDSMDAARKFIDEDILEYDDVEQSVQLKDNEYKVQDSTGQWFTVYIVSTVI